MTAVDVHWVDGIHGSRSTVSDRVPLQRGRIMTKRMIMAAFLVTLLCGMPLVSGCGGGGEEETATPAEDAASAENAAPVENLTEALAVHDCAGDCGMTNVPEDQLTEVAGKWYCAGCALKAQEADEDHSGHDHE